MSDPMSSVEIEDVLSSIRRLVSEDLRPAARTAGRATAGDPLVLTPALRVVTEAEEAGWTEVAAPGPAALDLTTAPTAEEAGWEEADLADGGWTLPDLSALRRNPAARLVDTAREVERPHRITLTQAMAVPPAPPEPDPWMPPPDAFDHRDPATDEAAFPGGESFDPADTAFVEADPAMPDLDTGAMADLAAEAFVESDLMPDEPEVTYDEDLLRDLVRDLIREELAGELGEKITRNIRKLVRAEIAQALAARALD